MNFSKSTRCALVAVGYVAEHDKDGAVLAARISEEYSIPLVFLVKILQKLARAGVLRSKRGPHGGFFLARRAEEINLLQIVEAVDGPFMDYLHLAELAKDAPFSLKMEAVCRKASEGVRAIYENSPLSNFIDT